MRIGPYEVLGHAGRGGMGVVLRARSPEGRDVAIKLLRRSGPEVVARFEREKRLLGSLGEADGFVPLLDAGTVAEGPYLVMPFLGGGTLAERIARGPFSIAEALALGRALALALGRAHERGIVHRDVKPENVLFAGPGTARPLVADLGLAKHFGPGASESVSLSRTGEIRGTVCYMAPEQLEDAKSVGPPADVFALGAVLYECLAGRPAFAGESALEVASKVARCELEPLARVRPETPSWLVHVVERSLARAPGERPRDGAALARALAAPGEARRPVLLVGALVLLAAGAGTAWILAPRRRPPPAPRTPAPVARPAREEAQALVIRAEAELGSRSYDAALGDYSRAIELDPTLARAWCGRGLARSSRDDVGGAYGDFARAIELDPTLALAWANRGSLHYVRGELDEARRDLDRAVELDPNLALARRNRGLLEKKLGDLDAAKADLLRATELKPNEPVHWSALARTLARRNETREALAAFDRAIQLDPGDAEIWRDRGILRAKSRDLDGAIADLSRALELAPSLDGVHYNRGLALATKGENDRALEDMEKAVERDPGFHEAWLQRALLREKRNDVPGAVTDLERFLVLAPDDARAASVRQRITELRSRK